jgi:hypothetical protein
MNEEYDAAAITAGSGGAATGVPHGEELLAFAEAVVGRDVDRITEARETLRLVAGQRAVVDTAGVIANFHRMTRVADGSGIPLDERMMVASADLRATLGIDDFRKA